VNRVARPQHLELKRETMNAASASKMSFHEHVRPFQREGACVGARPRARRFETHTLLTARAGINPIPSPTQTPTHQPSFFLFCLTPHGPINREVRIMKAFASSLMAS
jgi:hypothetical protein